MACLSSLDRSKISSCLELTMILLKSSANPSSIFSVLLLDFFRLYFVLLLFLLLLHGDDVVVYSIDDDVEVNVESLNREHDIAYSQSEDINKRHQADNILTEEAWQRVKSKDSDLKERINAWFITNGMKAKVKFGLGMSASKTSRKRKTRKVRKVKKTKVRKTRRGKAVKKTLNILKKAKPNNITDAVKITQNAIHSKLRMSNKGNAAAAIPRVIPVPILGGFLPLVPILTALSALGGLATSGSAIVKAVNDIKNGREQLAETARHNRHMESIAMGRGLYLKPYRKGYGLYYRPAPKNF
uniref:Uncharacterized protein n=1 Tax=Glossina morsitans morsitans TaxID=37546 RepID=A0A1B0G602_GLOMM